MRKLRFPFVLNRSSPQARGLLFWGPGGQSSGNLFDFTKNGYNGNTVVGTIPAVERWAEGVDGGGKTALTYNGSDNRTILANSTDFPISTAVSVALWVKTSNVAGYNYLLVKWGTPAASDSFHLRLDITTGFVYWNISTTGNYQPANDLNGTSNVADGNWHHVVATYDGATEAVYVDGKLEATLAVSGNVFTTTSDVTMGGLSDGTAAANDLNGLIDDPRIYNYALPATLIKEMYNPPTRWVLRYRPNFSMSTFTTPFVPPPPPPPPTSPVYFEMQPRDANDGWNDEDFLDADFDPRNASAAVFNPLIVDPNVNPAASRPIQPFTIDFTRETKDQRQRRHETEVAMLLNALGRLGAIQGTLKEPYMAYFPANRQEWAPDVPTSIWDALDAIVVWLNSSDDDLAAHLADTVAAHAASAISVVPTGAIASTDVQTALAELDTEKLATTSYTATDVLAKIITVDGPGSLLDADFLDGLSSAAFEVAGAAAVVAANLATHIANATGAHAATAISFAATGEIAAVNVQTAIAELDTEKASLAHAKKLIFLGV